MSSVKAQPDLSRNRDAVKLHGISSRLKYHEHRPKPKPVTWKFSIEKHASLVKNKKKKLMILVNEIFKNSGIQDALQFSLGLISHPSIDIHIDQLKRFIFVSPPPNQIPRDSRLHEQGLQSHPADQGALTVLTGKVLPRLVSLPEVDGALQHPEVRPGGVGKLHENVGDVE